jgi:prepilin-type N-terminal cleavage/methylation domain-containing protein
LELGSCYIEIPSPGCFACNKASTLLRAQASEGWPVSRRVGVDMHERGFSLIEVLIVVAIIMIIAAIALPSFMHSKIAANEASAVYSIRTINTAQVTYQTTYPSVGYASTLNSLAAATSGGASSSNAGILDWVLGCSSTVCPKSGYNFQIPPASVTGNPVSSYSVWGTPISQGVSGYRSFCSDNMNPVLVDPTGANPPTCTVALQ